MTKKYKIKKILISDSTYSLQNKSLCFLSGNRLPIHTAGKGLMGRIQDRLKRWGGIYYSLLKFFGPVTGSLAFKKEKQKCLSKYTSKHIIINIGSGPQTFEGRTDIINVDMFAFDEVDLVADAAELPIEDCSVDFIINIAMLEHVDNPNAVLEEMYRILKPGGEVLAYAPFIVPYHAAPHDYSRWTHQGLKTFFSSFDDANIFIGCGPTSGILYVLEEWLAILLSFGSNTLHDIWFMIFMIILFPFKYFDLLLERFDTAVNIASGFGIVAKKSIQCQSLN
ncbi:MAG TPA: hypothetical protein DD405_01330 [Desulfobacteraceae bacterium]|nr:hypothetical protein [Desulfobacteraceae bacterium]